MSTPAVPRDLQLPPSQRRQSAFREQRREKLKEQLLKRKTLFASSRANQITSRQDQRLITSKALVQGETKVVKLKAGMANKENIGSPKGDENNVLVGKNCIPLKPSEEFRRSPAPADECRVDSGSALPVPPKDDAPSQHMTLSQAFHLKNHSQKKQTVPEKTKQEAHVAKKPVLGSYRGQIVPSKVGSFRKPLQVKDRPSGAVGKPATALSRVPATGTRPPPADPGPGASTVRPAAKPVGTAAQNRPPVRPPLRSHQDNQDPAKPGGGRTFTNVTVRKGPRGREAPDVKSCVPQFTKQSKAPPRGAVPATGARPAAPFSSKLAEKAKPGEQRRHTIAKATLDGRLPLPKETAEERRARLSEWRASQGRVLKRPPHSTLHQPEPTGQNENPVASFWTTMAEEDEQRLFTEKVNKTFSECLKLIAEGCPKEEVLATLSDLVQNIPEAKKLVKYWICLARIEPPTSPIESVIGIYEQAILAGAQPIEEMRQVIVDILTAKNQEKVKSGGSDEAPVAQEEAQGGGVDPPTADDPHSGEPETKAKQHRHVAFQDGEKLPDVKGKDPDGDTKTPTTENRASCLIKYNVSTTPYLQSIKKKIQFDETNSAYKELKFLTPVRRSRRLQEKTSQLPDMLKDHYPCVSSLEQLRELGKETDAFVCRPNAALCGMFLEPEAVEQ